MNIEVIPIKIIRTRFFNEPSILFGYNKEKNKYSYICYNNSQFSITPTEKKNETEKCKTILSSDVNAPSVGACFHLTAFYSG